MRPVPGYCKRGSSERRFRSGGWTTIPGQLTRAASGLRMVTVQTYNFQMFEPEVESPCSFVQRLGTMAEDASRPLYNMPSELKICGSSAVRPAGLCCMPSPALVSEKEGPLAYWTYVTSALAVLALARTIVPQEWLDRVQEWCSGLLASLDPFCSFTFPEYSGAASCWLPLTLSARSPSYPSKGHQLRIDLFSLMQEPLLTSTMIL